MHEFVRRLPVIAESRLIIISLTRSKSGQVLIGKVPKCAHVDVEWRCDSNLSILSWKKETTDSDEHLIFPCVAIGQQRTRPDRTRLSSVGKSNGAFLQTLLKILHSIVFVDSIRNINYHRETRSARRQKTREKNGWRSVFSYVAASRKQ